MKTTLLSTLLLFIVTSYCLSQAPETMLDTTFSKDGKLILSAQHQLFGSGTINALTLQDDKIIAAGYGYHGIGLNTDSFRLVRINSNGSVDVTFGRNGVASFNYPGGEHRAHLISDVQCQRDDKILVNTFFWGTTYIWRLVRLNKNGKLDSTFGDNGFISTHNYTDGMLVLPNDEIITTNYRKQGSFWYIDIVLRNKDGNPVKGSTVMLDKHLKKPYFSEKMELRLTDDNKIVLAFDVTGKSVIAPTVTGVIRYKLSLSPDSSFNNTGVQYLIDHQDGDYNTFGDLTIQNGNQVIIGFSGNTNSYRLTRLLPSGKTDTKFGTNGIAEASFGTYYEFIYSIGAQKDNKIVAFGTARPDGGLLNKFSLMRFTVDGKLDSAFGVNGLTQTNFIYQGERTNSDASAMMIQPDGKIVCGGTIYYNEIAALSRYLPEKTSNNTITKAVNKSTLKTNTTTISISPNPVTDILNISSKNLSYKNISVIDASGKVVLKDGFAGNNHPINVSGFSAGVYYIQMINGDKKETIKFIKQ